MKTYRMRTWLAACTAGVSLATPAAVWADDAATAPRNNVDDYTGIVTLVNPQAHSVEVKGWALLPARRFELGNSCTFNVVDKNPGAVNDLRPGEKVRVSYQDVHGVYIASRVDQEPMRYEGMVAAIDPDKHTLTLHSPATSRQLQWPADSQIVLRDGRTGGPADVRIGDHVTVTYEEPNGEPTIRQIAETSIEFTGTLTAIDLDNKTVRAKSGFTSKDFNLANNCAIVMNGRTDGELGDLKPNERLTFSYDEVNGVDVVNRIGPAGTPANAVASER
jgi:hypothetical protein